MRWLHHFHQRSTPCSPRKKRNLFRFTLRLTIGSSIENLIIALEYPIRSCRDYHLASIVDFQTGRYSSISGTTGSSQGVLYQSIASTAI